MAKPATVHVGPEHEEALDILRRADTAKPDEKTLAVLRKSLKEVPHLWEVAGNSARITQQTLIEDAGSNSALLRESMSHACEFIKAGLGYEDAPMLEKLLIECVVLSWLRWSLSELRYTNATRDSIPISQADYWVRKLSADQRRYLRAITALARVRKMKLPALQVNIGEKQVNLVGR